MVNIFLTKVPRQFKGGKNSLFHNVTESTGYPHTKEESWTPTSYHRQKLTQNGSWT